MVLGALRCIALTVDLEVLALAGLLLVFGLVKWLGHVEHLLLGLQFLQ